MDFAEILKIAIPILAAVFGALFVLLRWVIDRQQQATLKMWELIQETLIKDMRTMSRDIQSCREEVSASSTKNENRVVKVQENLSSLREEVAGNYIKTENWLSHETKIERKLEQIWKHMHDQIEKLQSLVSKTQGAK